MQIYQPVGWPIQTFTGCLYRDTCPLLLLLRGFTYLPGSGILPKGSDPNIKPTPQTVIYLEGNLVPTRIKLDQITKERQNIVNLFRTLFSWLVENAVTDKSFDWVVHYMSMVQLQFKKIEALFLCLTFPPTNNNWLIFDWQSQELCCSLVCYRIFDWS